MTGETNDEADTIDTTTETETSAPDSGNPSDTGAGDTGTGGTATAPMTPGPRPVPRNKTARLTERTDGPDSADTTDGPDSADTTDGPDTTDTTDDVEATPADRDSDTADPATAKSGTRGSGTRDSGTRDSGTRDSDEPPVSGESTRARKEFSITLSSRSLLRAAAGLIVIALVAGVGVLGWLFYQDQQRLAAFDSSKQVSEDFVSRLVTTINPGNTDKYKEILGPLSTGELRTRLEQDRAATEQNSQALAIEATSKILSSSVESFDSESAKTTVMAEVTARSAKNPAGETRLMIFVLNVAKVDGTWLISDFSGPPGSEKSGIVDPSQSLPGQGQQTTPAPTPGATPEPTPAPGG